MREHGVLSRILLIYEEIRARLNRDGDFPVETLAASAGLVRSFVEDYHEKLEEDHIFPRFEKAGRQADLVKVLLAQHRSLLRPEEFIALGETFEDQEDKLFGEEGFEKVVGEVGRLEKTVGIYELAMFTGDLNPSKPA